MMNSRIFSSKQRVIFVELGEWMRATGDMSLFILAYSFCFTNDPKEICYVLADRGENEKS
jgi:hypothetical protein